MPVLQNAQTLFASLFQKILPKGPICQSRPTRHDASMYTKRTKNDVRPQGPSAGSRHLGQARDVAGQRVNFEVHGIADGHIAPGRDLLGMWNEVDAEHCAIHLVYG